ncbi:MraY family glycosyltransferase [Natronincola ferrireducens]|uniref:UDP-N-acetylmuramyl pentapeptide phosphotransferase/UDP-N-acetylglucosamine-1-phosphate transferase n=1 Tax=Natronincola ferrireducens TaxID=393762 RepID=A0A1G9CF69_9FIRM|nr:glycosyltransferase [Natronincola ferrireducens]SDK50343.1 UDP-N-acetylmuramyl pentapeptide phosphotransferase/UDP-N-acetylglucosamine-1-phosphate transferase [Natronincola ferrireducens]
MGLMILVISIFFTKIIIFYVMNMLLDGNVVAKNYKGERIPIGMGITFIPVMIINTLLLFFVFYETYTSLMIFFTAITTMAFVGIIDDLIGNRNTLGFKGHFLSFIKGKLTTGFFKAAVGGIISLVISYVYSNTLIELVIHTFVIALFTNLLNLLDLRPGRAIKGYLVIALLFILMGVIGLPRYILLSIIGYCVGYLPQDLKARSMMGDVGSNPLGISLGIIAVTSFSMTIKYLLLAFLIVIHLIAEKYSLSNIIKNNVLLNYIDELGRN